MHLLKALPLILCGLIFAAPSFANTYYVDGDNGNDTTCTGTQACPWKTLQSRHVGKAQLNPYTGINGIGPGDTIYVIASVAPYQCIFMKDWSDTDAGYPDAPIEVIGIPGPGGNKAKVVNNDRSVCGQGIQVNSRVSYLTIRGFNVVSGGPNNTNGIGIHIGGGVTGGTDGTVTSVHHITVRGNFVHDSGSSGIGATRSDYITIYNNRIWNNGYQTTTQSGSGISIYEPIPADLEKGYHIIIRDNTIYNNAAGLAQSTDGNGIIIDDNRCKQHPTDFCRGKSFEQKTLVKDNIIYGNNGRGIHVYSSNRVVITGNILYHNCQPLTLNVCSYPNSEGEISMVDSGRVTLNNNIMIPDQTYGVIQKTWQQNVGKLITNCNVIYGGLGTVKSTSGAWVNNGPLWTTDPQLEDPANGDFDPTATSPDQCGIF